MNFYQMCDKLNGKPYTDGVPKPSQYKFKDYLDSNAKIGNTENSNCELTPLSDKDTARYAADDVTDYYSKMHNGKNPYRLGPELSDDEFRQYCGLI